MFGEYCFGQGYFAEAGDIGGPVVRRRWNHIAPREPLPAYVWHHAHTERPGMIGEDFISNERNMRWQT